MASINRIKQNEKKILDTLDLIKEVLPQDLLGRGGTVHHLCLNSDIEGTVINGHIGKPLLSRRQKAYSKTMQGNLPLKRKLMT